MSDLIISALEKELEQVDSIVSARLAKVSESKDPSTHEIFLASAQKRQGILRRKLRLAKSHRAAEAIELRLHATQMRDGSISLRHLAKLSGLLNGVVENASWRAWDRHATARPDEKFVRQLDLRLADLRSGSTTLTVLGNISPDLTGESALEEGLSNLFELLNASNEDFADKVNSIGVSASKPLAGLLGFFEQENIAVELRWKGSSKYTQWDGRPANITRLRVLLDDCDEPQKSLERIRGYIRVLSVRGRIEIYDVVADRKVTVGYHRELAEEVNQLHLEEQKLFLVERTVFPFKASGQKKDSFRLEGIEDIK